MVISRRLSMMNLRKNAKDRLPRLPPGGGSCETGFSHGKRVGFPMPPRKPNRPPIKGGNPYKGERVGHHGRTRPVEAPDELWIYGQHAVVAALANPERQKRRFIATPEAARRLAEEIGPQLQSLSLPLEEMHRRDIDKLLPEGAVHQGLALLSEPLPDQSLSDWTPSKERRQVVIALDQVTDPHNVGAVIRSAVAFGAGALLLTRRHSPAETGVLAKTASGALEHLPILRETNLSRALEDLKDKGFLCIGLAGDAAQPLSSLPKERAVCLVMGAEGKGLRQKTRETCDLLVRLPTLPPIDQLNVSNATAICLYELLGRG